MKKTLPIITLLAALGLAASVANTSAQEKDRPPRHPRPEGGPGQGQGQGQRPPAPPLFAALDANRDGTIDATEIDNAPAALRKLDKNGDGKLTPEELRPPRPEGGNFGPEGERRMRGEGGPQRRMDQDRPMHRPHPPGPPPADAPDAPESE